MNKIAITLDIDWAPEEIIKYVVKLLDTAKVKATFFATHDSVFLKSLDKKKYEVGIHPNYTNNNDWSKITSDLKKLYPDAIGARSHGLTQSSAIHGFFIDSGIKYDANTYMPLKKGLSPCCRPRGDNKQMICIPYYWGDDSLFLNTSIFDLSKLRLNTKGLKIFSFHPMHIFMNTKSNDHYLSYKQFYQQPDALEQYK